MKKYLLITLCMVLITFSVYSPFKQIKASASALTVVDHVAQIAIGEKVLEGIAEKAGVKYATQSARDQAIKRWNLDLWNQVKTIDATGGDSSQLRSAATYFKNISASDIVPDPARPGFGKVLVSAAAFLTGADILIDSTNAIKSAGETKARLMLMNEFTDGLADGEFYVDYHGLAVSTASSSTGSVATFYLGFPSDPTLTYSLSGVDLTKSYYSYLSDIVQSGSTIYGVVHDFWTYLDGSLDSHTEDFAVDIPGDFTNDKDFNIISVPYPSIPDVNLQPWADDLANNQPVTSVTNPVPVEVPLPDNSTDTGTDTWNQPDSSPGSDTGTDPGTDPGGDTTGGDGGDTTVDPTDPLPIAFIVGLFDLLRAIIFYLIRMFNYVMTLPFIPAKTIDNVAFDWFKNALIMGVPIYSVVSSMASIGFSFAVYKAIKKVLP